MTKEQRTTTVSIAGRDYKLHLGTNSMIALEERLSTDEKSVAFGDIVSRAVGGSFSALRHIVWASLLEHQPEMTVTDAGDLIDSCGGFDEFAHLLKGVSGVSPQAKPRTAKRSKRA